MVRRWMASLMRTECLPVQAAFAALFAGTVATVVQMMLWWIGATPVVETLLRDARLTAAIVMGRAVLIEGTGSSGEVLAIATLIHFGISFIYAAIVLPVARGVGPLAAVLLGAAYGLAIYAVNLHGFTEVFPWFSVARGWETMAAHLAFGVALVLACRWFKPATDANVRTDPAARGA